MARKPVSLSGWIDRHLKDDAPRARSLIVTIFGDSVAPYSDGIWLGDLFALMAPFGANERLVRTSVFRLTEEGWLVARRDGRRSYYTLAPHGRRRFQTAYDRVYKAAAAWDGTWSVVVLPKTEHGVPERVELRRELEWEGFGQLAPGVFLRPAADTSALRGVLDELGLAQRAVVFEARDVSPGGATGDLVAQCWDLEDVTVAYRRFIDRYAPPLELLDDGADLSPEQAFVVQSLLIDTFRRVTIHDPRLPPTLLPPDWPGQAAYQICQRLYRRTVGPAREHLARHFERPATPIPTELRSRFGGLDLPS
jgi:phenylacetic acid degradation operon negative regulatory protein